MNTASLIARLTGIAASILVVLAQYLVFQLGHLRLVG